MTEATTKRSRWDVAVGLTLLIVLVALSLFICSPWHRHNRLSGQACAFTSFEHAPGIEAGAVDPLPPPVALGAYNPCPPAERSAWASRANHEGRGPPA